jgi:hypothetical protein
MEQPPANMRKGLDQNLVWALKTSPSMLFKDWADTPPEKAREYIFKRNVVPDPDFFDRATDRQLLKEFLDERVLPNLDDQRLEELVAIGLTMIAATKGAGLGMLIQGFKHPAIDRLKGFFELGSHAGASWMQQTPEDRVERPITREEGRAERRQLLGQKKKPGPNSNR